jgi:hypothetical protein
MTLSLKLRRAAQVRSRKTVGFSPDRSACLRGAFQFGRQAGRIRQGGPCQGCKCNLFKTILIILVLAGVVQRAVAAESGLSACATWSVCSGWRGIADKRRTGGSLPKININLLFNPNNQQPTTNNQQPTTNNQQQTLPPTHNSSP